MAEIPKGWTEVGANGPWGMGPEPFPKNVPLGVRYVDAFGNRCVMTFDGIAKVEGIGTGENHGKPDGEWWAWTPELAAGPTSSEPWVYASGTDASTVEVETPAVPVVIANPEPGIIPASVSGTVQPETPDAPTVVITKSPTTGNWLVREWHRTGEFVESEWAQLKHAEQQAARWVRKHL